MEYFMPATPTRRRVSRHGVVFDEVEAVQKGLVRDDVICYCRSIVAD